MPKILFQNQQSTQAVHERLLSILSHPENLPLWDDEISRVVPTTAGYGLTRQRPALNEHELLTVSANANQVRYHSQGGRLSYDLIFTLGTSAGLTTLTQELQLAPNSALLVPLKLLMPIANHAFAQKLQSLITLAESAREVMI
ncbi:SRPBCC family protein [Levilactobacillus tongjiangensis]|uniref:SRPBCC family protein n=1 Tax=Levilactobacillus tongjiangensis TaxID=2486023 RepID=A0ABW1SU88_9LACO|nr:SRPBCC family protein [Levilactobacillus tongjiangensis]